MLQLYVEGEVAEGVRPAYHRHVFRAVRPLIRGDEAVHLPSIPRLQSGVRGPSDTGHVVWLLVVRHDVGGSAVSACVLVRSDLEHGVEAVVCGGDQRGCARIGR